MIILRKVLFISAVFLSPALFAAGFQINEQSASGLGRSYSGEAAMIDNAGVVARNPAAMTYFEKNSLSVVGHYIAPNIDFEGSNSGLANADADDVIPNAFVPGLFYISPRDDTWAFGVALTSHFGLSSEYPSGYNGSEFADETTLKSVYLTPSVSYKMNEKVSLGLGLSYITGEGVLKSKASNLVAAGSSGLLSPGDTLLDLESDGDGFGWNLGLMWQLDEMSRLGLRYVASTDIDTDADYRVFSQALAIATGGAQKYADLEGTLTLSLPEIIELAYSRQLDDQWMIAGSIQRTGWSSFESIKVDDTVLKEEDWDDVNRYSLGADYMLSDKATLRGGLAFDESPVSDDNRTLTIPDTDRKSISIGGTFSLTRGSVDLGLVYIKGKSASVSEVSSAGTQFVGDLSSLDALIYSAAYNIEF